MKERAQYSRNLPITLPKTLPGSPKTAIQVKQMRVLEIKKMSMGRLIESLLPMSLTLRPPVILSKRSTRKRLVPTKLHKRLVNPSRRPRCKMKRLMTKVKTMRTRLMTKVKTMRTRLMTTV